ncbi:hypothetical protein OTK49_00745 [Vibrio coralliirubri]|uniref:hypothetical protein n=1 Tax=Vibrio coralliirubri TaxID=1516159 RepID=UPI002283440C|nr:hypothetical protein [Vibrio coralliirubri]MCY9861062.1 hypothetical protein [Vibrio coralliirubri]
MKIKVKPQVNIHIENKSQLINKRIAIRDIENFDVSIHYGATLLNIDYNKQVEAIDLVFSANPDRTRMSDASFIILNEGDFLPIGNWKMVKTLTSNFTTKKRYLFLAE